jgi:hypothetical protein
MGVPNETGCSRQIHFRIVFPVKYQKALLADDVERIIVETARRHRGTFRYRI